MKFKIYCINLYEREDKYNYVKKEFDKFDLNVHFIRNFKHELGGKYGCFDSHIQCLKDAQKNNLDVCLIFEDDIKLNENCKKIINNCLNFIKKNKNVDIINANGHGSLYIDKYYSNNIYSGKAYGADCIFLTKKIINKILKKQQIYICKKLHYDSFLLDLKTKYFISINPLIASIPLGSDNDSWSNNIFINIFQKLLPYTTLHLIFINNNIINIFKFLIENKFDKTKNLLIKHIHKYIKKFINNQFIGYNYTLI